MKKIDPIGIKNVNFSISLDKSDERIGKFRKQRLEHGFDDTETWNLDDTIAQFITPRLKRFKEVSDSYPSNYKSMEDWESDLQKMIDGFELWIKHFEWDHVKELREENHKKVDEALQLFAKNFMGLWW